MLEYKKDFRYAFDSISNMLDYPNSLLKNSAQTYKEYFQTHYEINDKNFLKYLDFIETTPIEKLEEIYTGFFDLNPFNCLYMGYHIFGENYYRSKLLVDLKTTYKSQSFKINKELPDHLVVILKFLVVNSDINLGLEILSDIIKPGIEKLIENLNTENSDELPIISSYNFHKKMYSSVLIVLLNFLKDKNFTDLMLSQEE